MACKTGLVFSPFSRRAKAGARQARSAGEETRNEGSLLSFNRLKKLEEITPVLQARYESPWRREGGGGGYLLREKELLMRMLLLQLQMDAE